jgi:hypothetical protein
MSRISLPSLEHSAAVINVLHEGSLGQSRCLGSDWIASDLPPSPDISLHRTKRRLGPRGCVIRPDQFGSSGGSGDLVVPPPDLSAQEQLDRYPRSAIPDFTNRHPASSAKCRCLSVSYSARDPVGDVAYAKSTVGAASWSRTAARRHAQPRLVQGRQRESPQMRLVAFLATGSRGGAAITIVYRLYGER